MLSLILDSSSNYPIAIVAKDQAPIAVSGFQGRPLLVLHEAISRSISDAGLTLKQLDKIAVIQGPGSWTGLNIAITTAKTLSQALDIPLTPISLLHALASSHLSHQGVITVIADANHDQVYSAIYHCIDGNLTTVATQKKRTLPELATQIETMHGSILLTGNAAGMHYNTLQTITNKALVLLPMTQPHHEALCQLSFSSTALEGNLRFDFDPLYLIPEGSGPTLFGTRR